MAMRTSSPPSAAAPDRDREPEQPDDDAFRAQPFRRERAGDVLATRVVRAATAPSSQPAPNALSHSVGSAMPLHLSHRCETALELSGPGPSYDPSSSRSREIGPQLDRSASRL
jgi:hypothetical protein